VHPGQTAVLDGEIVVLGLTGAAAVFKQLQGRFGVQNPSEKLQANFPSPTIFSMFCIVTARWRRSPLIERKQLLQKLVATNERIRISNHQLETGSRAL